VRSIDLSAGDLGLLSSCLVSLIAAAATAASVLCIHSRQNAAHWQWTLTTADTRLRAKPRRSLGGTQRGDDPRARVMRPLGPRAAVRTEKVSGRTDRRPAQIVGSRTMSCAAAIASTIAVPDDVAVRLPPILMCVVDDRHRIELNPN
jgi:hypothetical protein